MSETTKPVWTPRQLRLARKFLPYLVSKGWIESRRRQQPIDHEGRPIPWITYPALSFLEGRINPRMRVFEFGSGNSTLWWAERVQEVTAIEDNESWATRIGKLLPPNASVRHVPLVPGGEYHLQAQRSETSYDVIVIDGRDRVNCAMASIRTLTADGVIVWDNSERGRYASGLKSLENEGFRRIDFCGPAPMNDFESQTSIFYRTDNCLRI
jgi:hypothetical protein